MSKKMLLEKSCPGQPETTYFFSSLPVCLLLHPHGVLLTSDFILVIERERETNVYTWSSPPAKRIMVSRVFLFTPTMVATDWLKKDTRDRANFCDFSCDFFLFLFLSFPPLAADEKKTCTTAFPKSAASRWSFNLLYNRPLERSVNISCCFGVVVLFGFAVVLICSFLFFDFFQRFIPFFSHHRPEKECITQYHHDPQYAFVWTKHNAHAPTSIKCGTHDRHDSQMGVATCSGWSWSVYSLHSPTRPTLVVVNMYASSSHLLMVHPRTHLVSYWMTKALALDLVMAKNLHHNSDVSVKPLILWSLHDRLVQVLFTSASTWTTNVSHDKTICSHWRN